MANEVKFSPQKILQFFKNMEKKKLRRLIILASIIIVIIISVSVVLNQKTYSVLYSGMEPSDAAQVLSTLDEMGVDAKADGESTILVAGDEVDTIRLQLASQGYPSSGLNYDLYKNATGLGVTDAEKKIYYQYQLQENLRTTIMEMDKVDDAVVNIDLGQDSSYVASDNNKASSASILLTLKEGKTLNSDEVNAIAELVSKSISGLELNNVRIVDTQMHLYTVGAEDETENTDAKFALKNSVQSQFQQQIINLLSPVFGEDNVLAEVSVTLNFDKTVSESVEYSTPKGSDDGLVVSMKELVEAITNDTDGSVAGFDANGNASQYLSSLESDGNAVYYDISREVNYEVNQTTTQVENAKGKIDDISVSVILNSTNIDNYSDEVKQLIATAIGANADNITVEMLPFDGMNESADDDTTNAFSVQQQMLSDMQSQETMRLVVLVIAGLIVAILLFSIIKMFRPKRVPEGPAEGFELVADEEIVPEPGDPGSDSQNINFDSKDDNLSVLEEYIDKNPEAVANLLRNWLNEE